MPLLGKDQKSLMREGSTGTNHPLDALLTKRYCLILSGRVSARKWCQDRALFDGVSQVDAAEFLARKYKIYVVLTPDHDLPFYYNQTIQKV